MPQPGQWEEAIEDALRGIAGGLVFGVPLLYTMEVWELGQAVAPGRAVVALALTFVPVFLLVATSGFRNHPVPTRLDVLVDVVTAVGLALLSAAAVLVILQRITSGTPILVAAQMIVFEAAPFAIGAAVATEVFNRATDRPRVGDQERNDDERARATISDLGATAVGATFIALSIAPTDEVPMLAAGIGTPWLAVLAVASLVVTYAIVFTAGFSNEEQRRQQIGVLQRPATETAAAYLVSLAISAVMLWFFGNLELGQPLNVALAHTVVLSFPASVGGAAGRLVV
ncbi:MAG: TIGR02587 family membrane protein [Actinomycetota bacterium]|nr:TIGR02587 family membrane protein [Actinomycetota bacterium]